MLCSFEKYVAKNQLKSWILGDFRQHELGFQQQDFYPVICQPSNDH
jgi:hypothetical protein